MSWTTCNQRPDPTSPGHISAWARLRQLRLAETLQGVQWCANLEACTTLTCRFPACAYWTCDVCRRPLLCDHSHGIRRGGHQSRGAGERRSFPQLWHRDCVTINGVYAIVSSCADLRSARPRLDAASQESWMAGTNARPGRWVRYVCRSMSSSSCADFDPRIHVSMQRLRNRGWPEQMPGHDGRCWYCMSVYAFVVMGGPDPDEPGHEATYIHKALI
jgi:hypothetical protein